MFQRVLWLTDLSSASRLARRPLRRLCSGAERGAVTLVHPEARELQLPDSKVQERIASLSSGLLERGIDVEVLSLGQPSRPSCRIGSPSWCWSPRTACLASQPRSGSPEVLGSAGCRLDRGPPSEVIQHLVCYVVSPVPAATPSAPATGWLDTTCTSWACWATPERPRAGARAIRKKVLGIWGPSALSLSSTATSLAGAWVSRRGCWMWRRCLLGRSRARGGSGPDGLPESSLRTSTSRFSSPRREARAPAAGWLTGTCLLTLQPFMGGRTLEAGDPLVESAARSGGSLGTFAGEELRSRG